MAKEMKVVGKNDNLISFVDGVTAEPKIITGDFIDFQQLTHILGSLDQDQKKLIEKMIDMILDCDRQKRFLSCRKPSPSFWSCCPAPTALGSSCLFIFPLPPAHRFPKAGKTTSESTLNNSVLGRVGCPNRPCVNQISQLFAWAVGTTAPAGYSNLKLKI